MIPAADDEGGADVQEGAVFIVESDIKEVTAGHIGRIVPAGTVGRVERIDGEGAAKVTVANAEPAGCRWIKTAQFDGMKVLVCHDRAELRTSLFTETFTGTYRPLTEIRGR